MITKVRIRSFAGKELMTDQETEFLVEAGWYTTQCYFNDNYKEYLLENDDAVDTIFIRWENRNYEFTTRKR